MCTVWLRGLPESLRSPSYGSDVHSQPCDATSLSISAAALGHWAAKHRHGFQPPPRYLSLVENEMATNGEKILKAIKESGVTQAVFTGHSLGGAVAQVAHLYALMNWKKDYPNVDFRTLTFSAPMTFFFSEDEFDELGGRNKDELARLKKTLSDDTR